MKRLLPVVVAVLIAACAGPAAEPEPDFSRPLGHEDDGHMKVIVLGAIPRGDAVEYALHLSPAERPARLLDATLIRADGLAVTPLAPVPPTAAGEVRIRFPATDDVARVGVRYESPNGVRRVILVDVRR